MPLPAPKAREQHDTPGETTAPAPDHNLAPELASLEAQILDTLREEEIADTAFKDGVAGLRVSHEAAVLPIRVKRGKLLIEAQQLEHSRIGWNR